MKKFFYLFTSQKLTAGKAALLLGLTYFVNNILGLAREVIIANKFGATRMSDVFFASFKIPDLIFQFLILGTLSAAFIPVFTDYLAQKKEEQAHHVASSVLNFFLLLSLVAAVALFFLIPKLLPYFLPGFFRYPGGVDFDIYKATINTSRLLLISPIFFCISGVFGGILNSYKRFLTYALAPIFYNIAIIISALFFTPFFKVPVYGLALGVILGAFLHMAIQIPEIIKVKFRWHIALDFTKGEISRIVKLAIPRALTVGVGQINIFVDTIVASFFIGGISVLTYANNIQTLPSVVFGISVATATFPYLAEAISAKKMEDFYYSFSWGVRRILYFVIPATVGIIVLRAQTVRLIFGFGAFDWESTIWTIRALSFFIISLAAQGLIPLVVRAFYALQDTRTPLYIGLWTMLVNVIFTVLLPFKLKMGIAGVALAFSIASFFNLILLLFYLNQKIGVLDPKHQIFESFFRLILASTVMGILVYGSLFFFDIFVDTQRVFGLLLQTLGAVAVGGVSYIGITYLLKCEETRFLLAKVFKK